VSALHRALLRSEPGLDGLPERLRDDPEITKASVERLGLRSGDAVTAIIKSTEVMIGK
jgi:hypothetical protein